MVTCVLSGKRLVPAEVKVSSLSGKVVRSDLSVASDKRPARFGLPDEVVVCAVTAKRLLKDEADLSSLSGRWVDKYLSIRSAVSARVGLPDEEGGGS
jgi:hypothetical protein